MGKPQHRQITKAEMRQLGEQFKHMREYVGMTSKELAAELGCHQTSILRWEKGVIPQDDIFDINEKIRFIVKSRILSDEYLYRKYKIIHSLCNN